MAIIKFELVHTSQGSNNGFKWNTDLPTMSIWLNTDQISYIDQIVDKTLHSFDGLYKIHLKDYITFNNGQGTYLIAVELPEGVL
jgi:hypothetical protein